MKKLFVTILILTFVFSLVANSYADEKQSKTPAIYETLTAHIDDATGRIDAVDIEIRSMIGTIPVEILDDGAFSWATLNLAGLCKNPGDPGGEGIRVFKNFPDTTNPANEIQGFATTGCKLRDNKFRVYFQNAAGTPISFDPCLNPSLGIGYVNRGSFDIHILNPNDPTPPNLLESWWPEYVDPPKPAFTAMTVQDSLDGCASFPYWNILENDSTYHDTDSCDYNYHWGKFALKVNGDPASSYYLDLADGYATDVNFKLKDGEYFPFYLDPSSVPTNYYSWWAANGVVLGASGWQGWMWEIINGNQPQFYVYYDENGINPPIYKLIDGLQKDFVGVDQYLRVNGDFPQGDYIFYGEIEGCNDELSETVYVKVGIESCPPPTVIDITTSTTLIDDCTDSLNICIIFDDDMNTSVNPTVTYNPDVSSILPPPYFTGWTSPTTYCLKYYLTYLVDTSFFDIDVSVSGAVNEYCCPQVPDPYIEQDVFDIYTLNPEGIITLTPIPTTLDPPDIDNCVDTFKVKICYNDLMCQTVFPSITFDPTVTGTLLNLVGTPSWITNDCFEWVYEVQDYAMLGTVQVVIDSAQNWTCCNVQEPDTAYFDVDTEIPEATLAVDPNPVNGCYIDSIFTVTATYNDSMCLSVNPSIAFTPDVTDPASAIYTLELLPTPSWTPPNVFIWEYKIHDSDVPPLTVEVVVDGAKDWTCCNVQEPDTIYFDIHTDSPKVTSIDVTPPLLTRCEDSLQICVTYDRKMDISFEPNIVFNPDVSSWFTMPYSGTWSSDSTVYCKPYGWTFMPEIDYDCIDIEVTDARGAVDTCSIQEPDTCFCCLEIDWDRPSVVSITPSDLCVGSCDTDFSVTIVYDEPMCNNPLPTVTFIPTLSPDPFTFNPATSTWLNSTTAFVEYTVGDSNAYGCDVDIIVTDALDATCCSLNVQYPDTLFDAFNVDQIEPYSYLYDAQYNDTTCTVSFDWSAGDDGCPPCISKVEFYVWKDGGSPSLVYTDATGDTYGSFDYDLSLLQVLDPTLCLEGMWYGFTKAYDCCCNVEPTKTLPDDSVNVVVTATKFAIRAYDHITLSDTLREGRYFDVEIIAVNDCGLRDCDFEGCIEGCTNYNSNIVNLTLFSNPTWISGGLLISEHSVANQTMDDLIINVWKCPCCDMYSSSDPITVISPPIEPPTSTLAYDIPNDQGGWISIDYTLSLNDPFNSIHDPVVNPAYLPFIDYYVIARNSASNGSGTWHAIAFVNLYDPFSGDDAHVDIQVPAGDTLYPYRMAAVYSDTKLFGNNDDDFASRKTLNDKSIKVDSPEVIYLADNPDPIKGVQQSDWSDCGSAAGKDNIPAYANFTLFLEGPYQAGGTMTDGLPLPTKSPYGTHEDIGILPTVAGHNLIDWIYVELRNTETGETVQEANAFVLDNGKIVDTDGNYSLPFHYTTGKQYYIVIRHRNHLDVMSAERKFFGDSYSEANNINLTTYGSVYNNGFKLVDPNVYALYTGDASGNNQIQNDDKNDYWKVQVGQAGYLSADFNLNGQVQNNDKNDYWKNNVGHGSQVPEQAKSANNNNGAAKGSNDSFNKDHIGIDFTFANGFLAPDHSYYEFDVMVAAQFDGTKLGDTQTYINYSTVGFGESIVANSKITITKGTLLQGEFSGVDLYSLITLEDNTTSMVSIVYNYNFDVLPAFGNDVFTTPNQLMHVRIDIVDENATAGLSFNAGLMAGQQYESDNDPDNKYDPVSASDIDDSTLPVELSSFNAIFNSANDNIKLNWDTATETNVIGFNIYRSEINDLTRAGRHINYSLLDAAGTTTEPQSYAYNDVVADVYTTHYYWLEVVDLGGTSSLHGPIAYTPGDLDGDNTPDLIADTKLIGSWPNPARNSTRIQYQLKGSVIDQNATITVYNVRGELVRTVNGTNGIATLDTSDLGHGIYFYRLQTDDFSEIKKLIVVK
ncbi:MAG: T9SS type A sorting domain-containing protein [Candidatus Cloacimonetes bacterium]|nr:T9SS type A sorting domain-containing protein [Candidatus Cloacimonadota bacterium]